ncbi:hypothetical protein GQ457_01G008040 [Hibiscus cannabinus]
MKVVLPFMWFAFHNYIVYLNEFVVKINQKVPTYIMVQLEADDRYGMIVSEMIRSKAKLHNTWNKDVETTTITNRVPTSTSLHPSSGAKYPRHEFKRGIHSIDLPIVSVSAVFVEALYAGESSSRK